MAGAGQEFCQRFAFEESRRLLDQAGAFFADLARVGTTPIASRPTTDIGCNAAKRRTFSVAASQLRKCLDTRR